MNARQKITHKKTATDETYDFAEWALNVRPKPVQGAAVKAWVERKLKLKTLPPRVKRPGARFQEGDTVKVDANKHQDPETLMPYVKVDSEIGTVNDVRGLDVEVIFESGRRVWLQNANVDRGGGLFKYSQLEPPKAAPKFEIIYSPDPSSKSTSEQQLIVELYVQRGAERGDLKRHVAYYSGYAFYGQETKDGGWVLVAGPHQRMDPSGRQLIRSFNPWKGKVHYLGLAGHRPTGWKQQLEEFRSNNMEEKKIGPVGLYVVTKGFGNLLMDTLGLDGESNKEIMEKAVEWFNQPVREDTYKVKAFGLDFFDAKDLISFYKRFTSF